MTSDSPERHGTRSLRCWNLRGTVLTRHVGGEETVPNFVAKSTWRSTDEASRYLVSRPIAVCECGTLTVNIGSFGSQPAAV